MEQPVFVRPSPPFARVDNAMMSRIKPKAFFNIDARFSTSLQERTIPLFRQFLAFSFLHLPMLLEVTFIRKENHGRRSVSLLLSFWFLLELLPFGILMLQLLPLFRTLETTNSLIELAHLFEVH